MGNSDGLLSSGWVNVRPFTLKQAQRPAIATTASQQSAFASDVVSREVKGEFMLVPGNDRGGIKEGRPRHTAGGHGAG